ncbi:MAG: GGDEF domain-containing protein [Chloroflexota bacterium]|nr:MAG: GGDEF domain-containing protein [Chloroflexota bacterium]
MRNSRYLRLLPALLIGAVEVGIAYFDYSTPGGSLILLQSLPVVVASLLFGYTGYGVSFALALVLGVFVKMFAHSGVLVELDLIRLLVLALVGLAVAEASEDRRKLRELSRTDGLTGLPNYRWFRETLETEFLRSRRYGHETSLILADVDRFKAVNDTYGHQVGNHILRDLALILRRAVRDVDFPARIGGDEFAVLLPETSEEEAVAVAKRVQRAVRDTTFAALYGLPLHVGVSLGVATYPVDASTPDELIAKADAALYAAKRSGRGQVKSA